MAEEVTKYVSSVVFDSKDAMRKLAEYEKKMDSFQRKQISMARAGAAGRGRAMGGSGYSTKASSTLLADMLRQEESAQKGINQQKQFANRLELQNAAGLEKSKDTLFRSVWFMKQYNTEAEKLVMNRLREQVAMAKTAKQVRDAAAMARNNLRIEREKLRTYEKQNFLMKRMQASSQQMAGNMVSAFAIGAAGAGIVRTGQQFESVNNTMLAVSTNAQEAGQNFQFVRDESYRLGLSLSESGKNFAKMVSARGEMSLQDTKAAFTGIAEMSTLLGLSAEESTRATNALQQI